MLLSEINCKSYKTVMNSGCDDELLANLHCDHVTEAPAPCELVDEEGGVINKAPLALFDLANANLICGEIVQHLDLQSLGRFGATCKLNHEEVSAEIECRRKTFALEYPSYEINDDDNDTPRSWWRRHRRCILMWGLIWLALGAATFKMFRS